MGMLSSSAHTQNCCVSSVCPSVVHLLCVCVSPPSRAALCWVLPFLVLPWRRSFSPFSWGLCWAVLLLARMTGFTLFFFCFFAL